MAAANTQATANSDRMVFILTGFVDGSFLYGRVGFNAAQPVMRVLYPDWDIWPLSVI
jgi:hypothetical protein